MADNHVDGLTNCPVCFEEYLESGDFIPRILPCHHSICERCVKALLTDSRLTCPECRKKHHATAGAESFQQNRYIVTMITRQTAKLGEIENCEEHGNELNFFCKETGCNRAVCFTCLLKHHREHKVVEMKEVKEKKELFEKCKLIREKLATKKNALMSAKEDIMENTATCVETMKKKRYEINQHFEKMIGEAESRGNRAQAGVDKEVAAIDGSIRPVEKIEKDMSEVPTSLLEIRNYRETIDAIKKGLKGTRLFGCPSYTGKTSEEICGKLIRQEKYQPKIPRSVQLEEMLMKVQVILEDDFMDHQGIDLFDRKDPFIYRYFDVERTATLKELVNIVSTSLNISTQLVHPWSMRSTDIRKFRPEFIDMKSESMKQIHEIAKNENPWTIFLQVANEKNEKTKLQSFKQDNAVLLFLKYYNPEARSVTYCGHTIVTEEQQLDTLLPLMCQRAGLSEGSTLSVFGEERANKFHRVIYQDEVMCDALPLLRDGNILVFQRGEPDVSPDCLPVGSYFAQFKLD